MRHMVATTKGEETRAAILATAVDIASVEGLEGLTIGRLASELSMSKSGLFGHFGSKEGLQLATIEAAREIFIHEVVDPARQADTGLARLWALCDAWLSYMEREVFAGGCFFMAASLEFDGRPGPVREAIAANMQEWLSYLEYAVQKGQERGELVVDITPEQIAFELHAFYLAANWARQLLGDTQAANRARVAILNRLNALATNTASALPAAAQYQ
jgi:AcrR family transcriptional regulator